MYYENTGTRSRPVLTRRTIPGNLKGPGISRACVVDWNNDGLPDLLADGAVFINEGTAKAPKWSQNGRQITIPWGVYSAPGLAGKMADMDGNGREDVSCDIGGNFYSVKGSAYSPVQVSLGSAKVNGRPIEHPGPGYGDAYSFTTMTDWDGDGLADLLWGTQQGNIYMHRNLGIAGSFEFAPGVKLRLITGEDLKVGPPVVASAEEAADFTILQGSRIRFFGGDIDGDKIKDLAVTDTY